MYIGLFSANEDGGCSATVSSRGVAADLGWGGDTLSTYVVS